MDKPESKRVPISQRLFVVSLEHGAYALWFASGYHFELSGYEAMRLGHTLLEKPEGQEVPPEEAVTT